MTQEPVADPRDAQFDVSALSEGLGRRTGRAATTILLFAFLKLVLTLGTTSILARFVPPEQQGIFALAIPAVLIAAALSEFGLAQAVVQREVVTHRLITTLFWINFALGLLLTGVVMGLGGSAAQFYGQPDVAPVFVGLAPYVLFMVMTTPYIAILRRQMRIWLIEKSNLVALIVSSIMAIIAAFMGAGLWALVIQLVMNPALTFLYLLFAVGWRPSLPRFADLKDAKSALAFGGYLTVESVLNEFVRNIQIVIVGRYFSEAQVGLFYRSQAFALMPHRRIGIPLSGAFIPSLARLQDDPPAFRDMFIRQISRANLIMVPIGLVFCLCADAVVLVLLGPDWADAAPILQWLAVLPMTAMLVAGTTWALIACGHTKSLFYFGVFNAVVVTGSIYIAADYGLIPLVIASVLVPALVCLPAMMALATRKTHLTVNTYWQVLWSELIFGAIVLVLGFALRARLDWSTLPECIAIGVFVVAAMAVRIGLSPTMRSDMLGALRIKGRG